MNLVIQDELRGTAEMETVIENGNEQENSKTNEVSVEENVQEPETQNMEETSEDDNTYFEDNSEEVEEKIYVSKREGFLIPQADGSYGLLVKGDSKKGEVFKESKIKKSNIIFDNGKGNRVQMHIPYNASGNAENIEFIISMNGKMLISGDKGLSMKKADLVNSKNDACMKVLNNLPISMSKKDIKAAYINAKEVLAQYEYNHVESDYMNIEDTIDELLNNVQSKIKRQAQIDSQKKNDSENHSNDQDHYGYEDYKVEKDYLLIKADVMDKELSDIDSGYTKAKFCKAVRKFENVTGYQILFSNRSDNKGYGFNTAGGRYYKLNRNYKGDKDYE